jgi:hypothetical protein
MVSRMQFDAVTVRFGPGTINGNGKTFDGNTTLNLTTQYQVERLQYDGTNWDAF